MSSVRTARLRELAGLARAALRYEGALVFLWRIVMKVFSPLCSFGVVTLYEKDLRGPIVDVRAKVDVMITEAAGLDIERVMEVMVSALRGSRRADAAQVRTDVRELLQRGAKCFVAKVGDEIVHYNWMMFHWAEVLPIASEGAIASGGRFIVLNDDEAFCTTAYTVPAWRGRAIHTAVLHTMLVWLRAAGIRKAYTAVRSDNKSSWKTHERLEWTVLGMVLYVKPLTIRRAWVCRMHGIASRFVAPEKPRRP
jgi:GNAT superfamily N-acetyltransferase